MPTARVTMVIEMDAGSTWTKDTTMDQIYKQASGETLEKFKWGLLESDRLKDMNIRFIGEPTVTAVYNQMKVKP